MNLAYLIDTDWVIHHLNGHPTIIQRLQDLHHEGLGLSVVALAELYEGVYYARDSEQSEERLAEFLESVQLVGLDEETARIFGRQRGRLRAEGLLIGIPKHFFPPVLGHHQARAAPGAPSNLLR